MKKYITSIIVCFRCKRASIPLRKCTNELDYVCVDCMVHVGLEGPDIGNQSRIFFNKNLRQ